MKKYIFSSLFVLLSIFFVNAQTYYYQSGNVDVPANWNQVLAGGGTAAANFTAAGQVFTIPGGKTLTSSNWSSSSDVWTVSGAGSKIVVGDAATAAKLYIPAGNQIVGTVDVATLSTLQVESTVNPPFTAGAFSVNGTTSQSTLIFDGGAQQYLPTGTYNGSVSITGVGTIVTMLGAVTAGNGSSSPSTAGINVASGAKLITNNNNLTVKRSVSVVSSGGTIDLGSGANFSPYTGYNPIILTGTTGTPNISVGVKNSFTNTPSSTSNIVNLQWAVLSNVTSNSILTFQYNSSDIIGTLASPILGVYNGSYSESALSAITGSNPYTISQSGAAALGTGSALLYGIGNANSFVSASAPDAPTIGTAIVNGTSSAIVSFTAPGNNNGSAITSYTATSSPGNFTGTINQAGSGSITVNGLTNGVSYTFKVSATNASGTSLASGSSSAVTPGIFTYNSGNVDVLTSWVDASNVNPSNFTAAGQTFSITGAVTVNSWTSNATWTVSGIGSKVVVGDGSTIVTGFKIPAGNALAGTIDVQTSDTLYVESNANPPFLPGTFYANPTVSSGLIYDGSGTQYLNGGATAGTAQLYGGLLAIRGTNNTLSLNGHIIVGNGSSGSPLTAGISMISGTTLLLNSYSMKVSRSSTVLNGATVNFGSSGTVIPYTSYTFSFASGSNVITANANGLDASINYISSNCTVSYFVSGVNYTFNTATSTPFSLLANSTTTTSTSGTGNTSFTVTTATNIAIGQLIYLAGGATNIGTVTGVTGTTVSANITGAALASGVYVNFRNTSTNSPTITAGTITLGAAVTANATVTVNTLLALSSYNLTIGTYNLTTPGTAASLTGTGYIITTTGKLIRKAVPATATNFPIGTASYYLPLVLTNTTNARDITVGVGTTFTNAPLNTNNIVNAQWSILASGASTSTITFQYNSANITGTLSNPILGTYNSGYSESVLNTVTGTGPYSVTQSAAGILGTGTAYLYGIGNLNSFSNGTPGYYYYNSGNLDDVTSWGSNIDGTGTNPIDFTTDGQAFNITKSSIVNSWSSTGAVWTVSGTGSKVVVGSGSSATTLQIPSSNSIAGKVDVETAATLQVESNTNPPFTAGTFTSNSSLRSALIYDGTGTQYLPAGTYSGGLAISGTNNTVVLNGAVWFGGGTSSPSTASLSMTSGTTLNLNGFNVIIQRNSTISSGCPLLKLLDSFWC